MKIEEDKAENKLEDCCAKKDKCRKFNKNGNPGTFYGLGFVGAVVFFIQHSHSFKDGLLGILKAIVWPALVSYKLLEFFKF
jgi:hypothetical protein